MTDLSSLVRYRLHPEPPIQHGQGQVWKAQDLLYDRPVAIKLISSAVVLDETARLGFQKEAMAGARLSQKSPNIVRVYDLGSIDDSLYFAMEWIEGGTLTSYCGRVAFRRAIEIATQIASAVSVAHNHGIVHSDIAPMNVLYDSTTDLFKLADFGYLKIIDSLLISRGDRPLQIGGRPLFFPPPHRLNPNAIDYSTDTYALALTLYILVTGQTPDTDSSGLPEILQPVTVRRDQSEAPDGLRKLVNRFTHGRLESDNGNHFLEYLRRL